MMRNMLAMAALLLASACQQQAAPPLAQVDVQAASDAIAKLETAQIAGINARNVTDATGDYAADALFITNCGKTEGRDAIVEFYTGALKDPMVKIDYQPQNKTLSDVGTMAYSTATYTETCTDAATRKPITVKGTNLSVWRKRSGGSWELVRDASADSPIGRSQPEMRASGVTPWLWRTNILLSQFTFMMPKRHLSTRPAAPLKKVHHRKQPTPVSPFHKGRCFQTICRSLARINPSLAMHRASQDRVRSPNTSSAPNVVARKAA